MRLEELLALAHAAAKRTEVVTTYTVPGLTVAPFITFSGGKYSGAWGGVYDRLQERFTANLSRSRMVRADTIEELCDLLAGKLDAMEAAWRVYTSPEATESARSDAWDVIH